MNRGLPSSSLGVNTLCVDTCSSSRYGAGGMNRGLPNLLLGVNTLCVDTSMVSEVGWLSPFLETTSHKKPPSETNQVQASKHKLLVRFGHKILSFVGRSLSDIKSQCSAVHGIELDSFFLSFNGISLSDPDQLLSVADGSLLSMNIRIRGGSDEKRKVAVTLPQPNVPIFFLDNQKSPSSWLFLAETALEESGRYDSLPKFSALILALPAEVLTRVGHLLKSLKENMDPFQALSETLKGLYQESKTDAYRQIFKDQTLGKDKPSDFLRKTTERLESIQQGMTSDDKLLRQLFLSAMPLNVQAVLAVSQNSNLQALATIADNIIAISEPRLYSNALTRDKQEVDQFLNPTPTESQRPSGDNSDLILSAIERLHTRMSHIEGGKTHHSQEEDVHSRNQESKGTKHYVSWPKALVCHFHTKFQSDSRTCLIGCRWEPKKKNCEVIDLCVYHARFLDNAHRCLPGCRHYDKKNGRDSQANESKNL